MGAMPTNPLIEQLRGAVTEAGFEALGPAATMLYEVAQALVTEYDNQAAYVQYLMEHQPDPEEIRRLMVTTDPETVERVVSTVPLIPPSMPAPCICPEDGIRQDCPADHSPRP